MGKVVRGFISLHVMGPSYYELMIDLHVHSTMSDGTLTPRRLVHLASKKGLQAIAITDHDTVDGVGAAQDEGTGVGIEVVAGVEMSAECPSGILHILGYFVDHQDRSLLEALERLRGARLERVPRIIAKLSQCNVVVTENEIGDEAVGGVPGRPHIAEIMLRKGYVKTMQEAFDRYLKKGAAAYVEKAKVQPFEAINIIVRAGGIPVLAHPYSLKQPDPVRLEEILRDLISYGLQGLEVYYPVHTLEQTRTFRELASKLDLAVSGGSDFHGSNKPEVQLGEIPGMSSLSYSILAELKTRKKPSSRQTCSIH